MNKNTLNILADAISEVGAWYWWYINDDVVQMEFCDVMLYDESKPKKETHTTDLLAIRFYNNAFAVFLDNQGNDNWHEHLRDDDSVLYPVDTYELVFDDIKEAELLLKDYRNRISVKGFNGTATLSTTKHILCARCDDVGFIAGGDVIEIAGKKGKYTEEEIETAARKWWDYWKDYWKLRRTKDAYPKDYACEITIPVSGETQNG